MINCLAATNKYFLLTCTDRPRAILNSIQFKEQLLPARMYLITTLLYCHKLSSIPENVFCRLLFLVCWTYFLERAERIATVSNHLMHLEGASGIQL